MTTYLRQLAGLLAAIGCVACTPQGTASNTPAGSSYAGKPGLGQNIALRECSGCHALTLDGNSPHPDAKPFRDLSENYPVRDLEESLAEGIMVGHPDMPIFRFSPEEVEALIIYLESLQLPLET